MKVCSVEGCEKSILARGWCSSHYQRWYKWGDVNAPRRPGGAGRGETVHGTPTAHNNHGCRCELCREWHRTYSREWARANPEKRRATKRKALYGLSVEAYEAMRHAQDGRCAICRELPNERGLYVDHCHDSGAVRALLCQKCNAGIGMFGDDPDRMIAAAAYVLQFANVLGGIK